MPKIEQILQLQEQTTIPTDLLANTSEIYYDTNGDMYVKLHQGGDPGVNVTHQVIDLLYGLVPWKVKAILDGTQTIVMDATIFTCTPDEATSWSTAGGFPGQVVLFKVNNAAGVQIDFGAGFTGVVSILTTEIGIRNKLLYYDGATWREIEIGSGSGSGGCKYPFAAGKAFLFCFKLVDVTDFATPETGKSPTVTISKNGGAFVGLTGAPAVSEISNGWYSVTVPASDMVAGVVVLKAIDVGTAQEDFVIYLA
jgi:hypothetical protein